MSLQGAAGADELIFYVNGRKVSAAVRGSRERAVAVPEVTLKGVGTNEIWFPQTYSQESN